MNEAKKREYELTGQGKIILIVVGILIVIAIVLIVFVKDSNVEGISLEMISPNEGIVIDDPILGTSVELKVGKQIALSESIYPADAKVDTIFVVEKPEIAEITKDNRILAKKLGTTKIYSETKSGKKVQSNIIKITVVE